MKAFVILSLTLGIVGSALADPYSMAIQQAKRVSNQNAAEQRAISSAGSGSQAPASNAAPPPAPAAPAANPALQATLQNISNLGADIAAFSSSTNAATIPARKTALVNDLTAAAIGSKPDDASVQRLADDLITAAGGKERLISQQTKLGRDLHAIFNSSHLSTEQQYSIIDDVQKTLIENEASSEDTSKVLDDLRTIEAETK